MYINGYGSWGNCSDAHTRIDILNRFSPWYTNNFRIRSYGYIDDGHILYCRTNPHSQDIFDYHELDKNANLIKIQGETYAKRIDNFVSHCFHNFKLKQVIPLKGWCSWNTYFQYISPEKIKTQISYAKIIKENLDKDFKYFLIDFGYSNVGDLITNNNQWIYKSIEDINSQGLISGIWINPFTSIHKFEHNTHIKSKFKKLFLRTVACNSNKIIPLYLMSIHDFEYQELLLNRIKYLYDLGIRLFKFDFNIFLFWQNENYLDILKIYRKFYLNVRKVAPKAILIGCGVPLFDSIGLFDYVRVTKDSLIAPFSPKQIRNFVQNIRQQDINRAIKVRKPFDGLLWHADYDQIDDPKIYIKSNDKIKMAGFDLKKMLT